MAAVLMDSAVAPSMTATPISAAITEATHLTAAATVSPVVIALPAVPVAIVLPQAEATPELARVPLVDTAAAAKRAAIPPAEDLASVVAEVALTAAEATVAEAEQRLAQPSDYGLVITDWRLPDGDGIALADRAAGLGMNTAVLTGYAFHMSAEAAARHEVWMKPMRPVELIAAIEHRMAMDGCGNN